MNHDSSILNSGLTLGEARMEPSLKKAIGDLALAAGIVRVAGFAGLGIPAGIIAGFWGLKKILTSKASADRPLANKITPVKLKDIFKWTSPQIPGGQLKLAKQAAKSLSPELDGVVLDPCKRWGLTKKGCGYVKALTQQEPLAKDIDNYHAIIVYLSLLIEYELLGLVVKPLRRHTLEICDLLRNDNPVFRTEALENFANGKIKPTFWTLVMLLRGLEIGEGHYSQDLSNRINSMFHPSYTRSIRKANLSQAADTFRWKYRNPSCHPDQAAFSSEEAARACKLTLGFSTVEAWSYSEVDPEQHHSGLLSTHLALKRR